MSLDDGAADRKPDTHAVENGASYQALGHILEALRASYLNERSVCCVRRSRPKLDHIHAGLTSSPPVPSP
jgi:hypothetical protein